MTPKLDILICAYNEAENIARTLESLKKQTASPEDFRVLVVDNASKDNTREIVEKYRSGLNLEYIYEAEPGLNVARNAGYQNAIAPYVAHIDADATADPSWVERILKTIEKENPELLGGPYHPYYLSSKPRWFLDKYNSNAKDKLDAGYLNEKEFLSGTNMVWKKSVVMELGGFNNKVGLQGRGLVRGDETSLMVLARKTLKPFRVYYDPEIKVYHLTRPEMYSLWYWTRRFFIHALHGREVWGRETRAPRKLAILMQFLKAFRTLIGDATRNLMVRDKTRYPDWENYFMENLRPRIASVAALWVRLRGR